MDEAIKKGLVFLGNKDIRPNQEKVIRSYLEVKYVLFCSPTGSGKSLTFNILYVNIPSAFQKGQN